MRKYESDLIVGTVITFIGYLMLIWIHFTVFLSWIIIFIGKLVIVISIMGYSDRKRALRGENLTKDKPWKKKLRKIRRKYRY